MNSLTIKGLFSYIVTGGGTHPQILRGLPSKTFDKE